MPIFDGDSSFACFSLPQCSAWIIIHVLYLVCTCSVRFPVAHVPDGYARQGDVVCPCIEELIACLSRAHLSMRPLMWEAIQFILSWHTARLTTSLFSPMKWSWCASVRV